MKLLLVSVLLLFLLVGCASPSPSSVSSSAQSPSASDSASASVSPSNSPSEIASPSASGVASAYDGFVFKTNDVEIRLGEPAAESLAAVGKEQKYFESASCAFVGIDKTYYYDGYEINTYPVSEVDYFLSVVITDIGVSTMEGIGIGSTINEVKAAYGNDFNQDMGEYTYKKGVSSLIFLTENDMVVSITYNNDAALEGAAH